MNSDIIKNFYSRLRFPGTYSIEDIQFYDVEGIHNLYLQEIDKNLENNLSVLDVGCGTGLVSNLFALKYSHSKFTAVDFSDSIDYASSFSDTYNIKNINWVKEDFLKYHTNKQFDVIICCGVLHHIPEYQSALKRMKSLLKPKGKLLLALYNPYGKILKKFVRIKYHNKILYEDQENNPYELSFTSGDVLKLCADLRFISVEPSWKNKFVDAHALFNSQNGGLTIYVFEKT